MPPKKFTNWAETFSCVAAEYHEPSCLADVRALVRKANRNGSRVKVVGAGHSPSDLACTTGIMLSLDRLNQVLKVDKEKNQVMVQAGIRLKDLHRKLDAEGLAMSNLGSISEQSLAGAISTATHGTGWDYGVLSTTIVDMELVLASGEAVECSRTRFADLFHAALCGLGALGVITRLTVQVEPAYRLHAVQEMSTLDAVLDNLDAVAQSAEHARFWWFPHSEKALVWRANRTEEPVKSGANGWVRDRLLGYYTLEFLYYLSRSAPGRLVPWINRRYANLIGTNEPEVVDRSDKVFNFDCLFRQHVNEWAIPYERTAEALRLLRDAIAERDFKVHFPIEVRFVKKDDIWLSPAYGRPVTYIGIIMYRPYGKETPIRAYWDEYERIMASLGGRPHWAKAHGFRPADFERAYPRWADWLRVRRQVDPRGMFLNEYLERCVVSPDEQEKAAAENGEARIVPKRSVRAKL